MLKLGIITAASAYHRMLPVGDACDGRCEPHYLVYSSLPELERLYQANRDDMDGFFFSGKLPYDYIQHNFGLTAKTAGYCAVTAGDFYKTLLGLKAKHPNLDFSRVYIDATAEFLDLDTIFPHGNMPKTRSSEMHNMLTSSFYSTQLYDSHIKLYQKLWDQGDIDWVITRMPGAKSALKALGIRCAVACPSDNAVHQAAERVIAAMETCAAENAQIVCCLVDCHENLRDVIDPNKVESILKSYNVVSNMAYIIRREGAFIELTTSNRAFRRQTQDYHFFDLHPFISQRLGMPLLCSAGIGEGLAEARHLATAALREARHHPDGLPAIFSADGRIHTPDVSGSGLFGSGEANMEIKALAAAVEMSPNNVQRILGILDKTGCNRMTSEELAGYLEITRRSAARILSHLESRGAARRVFVKHEAIKGRPAKVYEINLGSAINENI